MSLGASYPIRGLVRTPRSRHELERRGQRFRRRVGEATRSCKWSTSAVSKEGSAETEEQVGSSVLCSGVKLCLPATVKCGTRLATVNTELGFCTAQVFFTP